MTDLLIAAAITLCLGAAGWALTGTAGGQPLARASALRLLSRTGGRGKRAPKARQQSCREAPPEDLA
jgi:hypothetical protein